MQSLTEEGFVYRKEAVSSLVTVGGCNLPVPRYVTWVTSPRRNSRLNDAILRCLPLLHSAVQRNSRITTLQRCHPHDATPDCASDAQPSPSRALSPRSPRYPSPALAESSPCRLRI